MPTVPQALQKGAVGPGAAGVYWIGYLISWVVIFLGCWVYCVVQYGFLLGISLGWLPSGIAASVIALLWPLVVIGIVVITFVLFSK